MSTMTLMHLAYTIDSFFKMQGIDDACPIIRVKDKKIGLQILAMATRESGISSKLSEDIGYVDIHGVRFVWPMK